MTPKVDSTTSKLASAKGSASASASWKVTGRRSASARSRAALEQRADIVGRHDVGEAAGGGERRIAVAGGDIEDALVAAQIDGLAEHFADDLQRGADDGVVAGAPGDLLASLDRGEIDGDGGGCLNVHRSGLPCWGWRLVGLPRDGSYLGFVAAGANDRASALLDTASGIL